MNFPFFDQFKLFLQSSCKWLTLQMQAAWHWWKEYRGEKPVLAWTLLVGAGGILFSFLLTVALIASVQLEWLGELPSREELSAIENNTASEVYSEDGVLLGKYYIQNRVNANLEEISPFLKNALIATEDARFFEHNGIDIRAWFRVFFKSILLSDDSSGGGSTLSQQLAKNLFPRQSYRLLSLPINKIREMIIARRLESIYAKEELLTLYLNTVPFSDNTYGVTVAAKRFFNTNPTLIKVEEAAVLVGMLKATAIYNPLTHPAKALERRNVILRQMQRYGYLSAAAANYAIAQPLKLEYAREGFTEGLATYFREHLRLELKEFLKKFEKEDGSNYNLYTDGLKIHTTIDAQLQVYAEEAVAEHMKVLQTQFNQHWNGRLSKEMRTEIGGIIEKMPAYQQMLREGRPKSVVDSFFRVPRKMTIFSWEGEQEKEMSKLDSIRHYYTMLEAGFLVQHPQSGHIKAWVGGIDNQYFKYDHVKSTRPVGSTFKPLVYASALEQGIPPCEYIHNRLVVYTQYNDWKPENSDGVYGGVYSMEGGLSNSVNSVAVDMIMQVGMDSVKLLAEKMGISSPVPAVPAIALGAVDASLWDMVQVYAVFANKGKKILPNYIRRIETKTGQVLFDLDEQQQEATQILDTATTQIMTRFLQSVVDSGTARRLRYQYHLHSDIAGKTGTTQNHSDGWFIGYTPDLVAGVWVGAASPQVRFRSIALGQGANMALPIWGRFMNKVYKDARYRDWQKNRFLPLSDSLAMVLDCAPYLEEMPPPPDTIFANRSTLFDVIFGKNEKEQSRNRRYTSPSELSREIKARNERLKKKRERKNKRKRFFDRIFNRGGI